MIEYSAGEDTGNYYVHDLSITGSRLAVFMNACASSSVQGWKRHLVVLDWNSSKVIQVHYSLYSDNDQQHSSIHTEASSG